MHHQVLITIVLRLRVWVQVFAAALRSWEHRESRRDGILALTSIVATLANHGCLWAPAIGKQCPLMADVWKTVQIVGKEPGETVEAWCWPFLGGLLRVGEFPARTDWKRTETEQSYLSSIPMCCWHYIISPWPQDSRPWRAIHCQP